MSATKGSMSQEALRNVLSVRTPKDYPWKVLDNLVHDLGNCLPEADLKLAKGVARSRDIQRYNQLSEAWSPQSIGLELGMSKIEFLAKYQIAALLKKYQFPSDAKMRRDSAKEKFLEAERACAVFNSFGSHILARLENEKDLTLFTYARSFLQKLLGPVLPDFDRLTLWSRHGPGANLDTKDRRTSLYDKYRNWPYSCTEEAVGHARALIESDERWLGALEDSYRRRYDIPMNCILDRDVFWQSVFTIVKGNRITFVPKNSRTDRSIAIEPAMNLCLQLGVDGFIRRRLKRWGVDLDSQTKNQVLAGKGSLNWEDPESFVTLDLSAASDSVSLGLCRLLLPSQWYSYLENLRSPYGDLDGETISFEKISSMGNGYTFALESAIFTAVVYSAHKANKRKLEQDKFAVFGDDIIVPKSLAADTVRGLNLFGFTINDDKSFIHGKFRESCGADWFSGTPVRPVFLNSIPHTVMEIWRDSNRIRRYLDLRVGIEESNTERLIDSWIPTELRGIIGPYSDEEFDSYKHARRPRMRYRNSLWEFNRLVIIPKRLNGKDFHFRKLMHPLRSTPEPTNRSTPLRWGGVDLETGGNVFGIIKANSIVPCVTPAQVSIWPEEYAELVALTTL